MKTKSLLVLIVSVFCIVGAAVAAETDFWFEDEDGEAIFYLTLPDGWQGQWQEEEGLSILHALPTDESVYLSVWAVHELDNVEKAAEVVDQLVENLFTDLKPEAWQEEMINEIPFLYSDATAKLKEDGTLVDLSVAFFKPAEDAVYLLLYVGTPDAWHAHKDEVIAIYDSIRTEEAEE